MQNQRILIIRERKRVCSNEEAGGGGSGKHGGSSGSDSGHGKAVEKEEGETVEENAENSAPIREGLCDSGAEAVAGG